MVWHTDFGHRSVEKEILIFCGWDSINKLVDNCKNDTTKLLALSLFKTGGRCNETLTLHMGQVDIQPDFIEIIDMPVHKRHMSYIPPRTFAIYRKEELTKEWIDLMPKKGKFFDFKYNKAYRLICDIQRPEGKTHGPWWPHRMRAERARQLRTDYRYDGLLLKNFFGWSRDSTAEKYAKAGLRQQKDRVLQSQLKGI